MGVTAGAPVVQSRSGHTCTYIDWLEMTGCGDRAVVFDEHQQRWVCALHYTPERVRLRSRWRDRMETLEN